MKDELTTDAIAQMVDTAAASLEEAAESVPEFGTQLSRPQIWGLYTRLKDPVDALRLPGQAIWRMSNLTPLDDESRYRRDEHIKDGRRDCLRHLKELRRAYYAPKGIDTSALALMQATELVFHAEQYIEAIRIMADMCTVMDIAA